MDEFAKDFFTERTVYVSIPQSISTAIRLSEHSEYGQALRTLNFDLRMIHHWATVESEPADVLWADVRGQTQRVLKICSGRVVLLSNITDMVHIRIGMPADKSHNPRALSLAEQPLAGTLPEDHRLVMQRRLQGLLAVQPGPVGPYMYPAKSIALKILLYALVMARRQPTSASIGLFAHGAPPGTLAAAAGEPRAPWLLSRRTLQHLMLPNSTEWLVEGTQRQAWVTCVWWLLRHTPQLTNLSLRDSPDDHMMPSPSESLPSMPTLPMPHTLSCDNMSLYLVDLEVFVRRHARSLQVLRLHETSLAVQYVSKSLGLWPLSGSESQAPPIESRKFCFVCDLRCATYLREICSTQGLNIQSTGRHLKTTLLFWGQG